MRLSKLSMLLWLISAVLIGMSAWYLKYRVFSGDHHSILDSQGRLQKLAEERGILPSSPQEANRIFMKIGNDEIRFSQIDFEVLLYTKSLDSIEEAEGESLPKKDFTIDGAGEEALRQKLLEDLIERKTLYQYVLLDQNFDALGANRLKECLIKYKKTLIDLQEIVKTDEDRRYLKSRICEIEILNQFFEEAIAPQVMVSEEEINGYFSANKESMIKGESIFFRQILLDDETKAKQVYAKIKPGNFVALAKTYSVASEKNPGELQGPFARGELPPFFDGAFNLNPGQISDLIKSSYGFHIIMLEEKITKDKMRLDLVKEKIIKKLKKQKVDEEFAKWLDIAMQKVSIEQVRKGS